MKSVVIGGYNPEFSSASVLDAADSILDGFPCMIRSQSIWTKMGRKYMSGAGQKAPIGGLLAFWSQP
jgi:hypothetical protein